MRVWVSLLVLAALAVMAAASTVEMDMELENSAYQWAELSDSAVPFSSSSSDDSVADTSHAEVEVPNNFDREVMELRASFNIESILEGRQHDEPELDAALLEMEISSALSVDASPADFYRFARLHSRLYANEKAAGAAFAAFKLNKRSAAQMNAKLGITSESEAVFSATGPLAAMNPAVFKKNILSSTNPRGRSKGVKVKLSKVNSANNNGANKSRSLKSNTANSGPLQPQANLIGQAIGAGHAAGTSGKSAGKSGKSGGKSGKSGGKSGKNGGKGGSTAKKSGKTGGGKKSGGGRAVYSSTNGTISLPGAQQIDPYQGFTDAKFAAQQKLTPASLREQSIKRGRITSTSYDSAYSLLKSQKARLIDRPAQFNSKGEYASVLPTQINQCGSCWAIAAQQSMQRYWTAAAFKGVLSIQQLLDCARTVDSRGCKGGAPMDGFEYWSQNLAANEVDYPTVMRDQTCKKPPFPNSFKGYPSGGWEMLLPECKEGDKNCDDQIQYEWLALSFIQNTNFQPPIAYVDGSMWQNYRGGIFPPSMCKSTMEAGNHVVQIVGAGVDNLGLPYWLLDNFWGVEWGEFGGRIRVPFGVNACGLFNFVIYATAPPFDQGKPVGWIPPYNSNPVPYTPKPLALKRVYDASGVIGKTQKDLKGIAQFIHPVGSLGTLDSLKQLGNDAQSTVSQAAGGTNHAVFPL